MQQLDQIQAGWSAFDQSGESIGDVQEVGTNYVLVSKGLFFPKDIYVPVEAINEVDTENSHVHVKANKGTIDSMGWDQPPEGDMQSAAYMSRSSDAVTDVDTSRSSYDDTSRSSDDDMPRSTSQVSGTSGARDMSSDTDTIRVPVVEESLTAEKRTQQSGEVVIDKQVVEEQKTLEVPVTREEVTINRVAVDRELGSNEGVTTDGDTIRVPIMAEEVSLNKEARVVEELEISKRSVTENQQVEGTVRREEVRVDDSDVRTNDR
ncbi:MAG: DUF2382 domain-containing protein [Chloroflexi bacterium]|nr:DUF2382 domain-containing protein [Chloroflexota bacterium]